MEFLVAILLTAVTGALLFWAFQSWRTSHRLTRKLVLAVIAAILGTLVVTLIYVNLKPSEKKIEHRVESRYAVADPEFVGSMGALLGPQILENNHVSILKNGDEFFPAMLADIRAAKVSICFESYIYWSGRIGEEFADALAERARNKVKVHVLLDWAGSIKMSDELVEKLQHSGVEVVKYHPIRWYNVDRMNNRTHRKLLIIDGRIGYTGGAGVADQWLGDAQDKEHWRDNQYRLTGPAVAQMQAAFMDNWLRTNADVKHGKDYFPVKLETTGTMKAQVFKSSKNEGSESARLMYLLSISAAKKSLRISNSYFVPDDLLIEMLVAAVKRGVLVEIIIPGEHLDSKITKAAMRARLGELLEAGAKIYKYQPTLYHCKYMIVDDLWTSVGSTNFDNRSFRLNDEANLNVLDAEFAREHVAQFEEDKAQSKLETLQNWKKRPLKEKALEKVAGVMRSQL